MLYINSKISIDDCWIALSFVHASGPGGQNVNKVATACQLRFDINNCPQITAGTKYRLKMIAGSRVTKDGILIIDARSHRTQQKNRSDALARLVDIIARAAVPPKIRKKAGVPAGIKKRRLENKRRKSEVKQNRKPPRWD